MPNQQSLLVNNWDKITNSECSEQYPDHIQFQQNGLYFTQNDVPGRFTIWDVGNYEVVAPNQVKISLATDAFTPYKFSIHDSLLIFVDADNCTFQYHRVG